MLCQHVCVLTGREGWDFEILLARIFFDSVCNVGSYERGRSQRPRGFDKFL